MICNTSNWQIRSILEVHDDKILKPSFLLITQNFNIPKENQYSSDTEYEPYFIT